MVGERGAYENPPRRGSSASPQPHFRDAGWDSLSRPRTAAVFDGSLGCVYGYLTVWWYDIIR